MRPYISLMELPINRPGSGNLLLGLTSVVGLIGGAYLLQCGAQCLVGKLANKKWRKVETSEDHSCNVCCADLDLSSAKNYVTCRTCGKSVCRGLKCADWRPKDASWECQLCQSSKESLAHTSSWVAEQMSFNQHKFVYPMRARSEVYIPIVGNDGNDSSMRKDNAACTWRYRKCIFDIVAEFESVSQIGLPANSDERAKIREYVEEIVAEMLGGNLDHIKVGQLSKSENYLQLFDKFHAKLSNLLINVENGLCARALKGDLPAIVNGHHNGTGNGNHNNNNNNNNNGDSELADISQTRLRSLIETIIAETLRSSSLSASGAVSEISLDTRSQLGASELANGNGLKRRHRTEHYFEPKIYQDLLATAVLNKIADKEGNTRLLAESTPDLSGRHIDENFNAEALSTTSGSSIEPRSDCSLTDHEIGLDNGKSQSLQADLERESVLSDYIAAHMVPLPDFSASVTESEEGECYLKTLLSIFYRLFCYSILDIGSISSSMIGDGNWEDNWLFKKKRSSVTPSSTGMLVPAPKENIRAQIGDKTADEVSDLSEMGSDAEDSSLDLLRSNDLNDRLLSKHLIGGQNTKLVLDELVDRTSLTSHTLPEEHEPAFTETTNAFVVSPPAVPSVAPPPMIFQDDSLNEELTHTPIAAQADSEELSSLDGCTGFSTVEYIDEDQMHENVPSVIEILAAMALGPMLAVPASEQPGAMTPSEMHTLKELSDLALAEINARTLDLVHHHSLDIIEEENTDLAETAQFSSVESSALEVVLESNSLTVEPDTESVLSVDPLNAPHTYESPSTHILSEAIPETEIVKLDSTNLSPAATEDIIPAAEIVAVEPYAPVETQFMDVEPPAPLEVLQGTILTELEPIATAEILPESQTTDVQPAAIEGGISQAALDEVDPVPPVVETQTVEPTAPVEVASDMEPPATIEGDISQSELEAVDSVPPAEVISETQTVEPAAPLEIASDVEPPAPVEILPESQSTVMEPAATEGGISQSELEAVDSVPPAEVISETQTVEPAPPQEIASDVEPPTPIEIIPESQSTVMEPAATEGGISQAAVDAVDSVPPVEEIPETQTVEPAAPLEIASDVEPPTPVEIIPESQSTVMEPAATEGSISQSELEAVDSVPPAEVISETQTVEPAPPQEIATDVEPPTPVEIIPESQSTVMEPAATEGGISQSELEAVDSVPPAEVISETQTVEPAPPQEIASDVEPPTPVEIIPESQSTVMEPAATEGGISQSELEAVDSVPPAEVISETQTVEPAPPQEIASDVEPAAPVEILPESQSTVMEPAATEGGISQAAVDAVDFVPPVEEIPETQTVEPAAPLEIASDVEPPAPVEIIPESQSTVMEPAATEGSISQAAVDAVDSVPPVEEIPETQTVEPAAPLEIASDVEPPTPVEIIPESQSIVMEPAATEEGISQSELEAMDSVHPVEVISETQTVEPAAPLEIASDVEPAAPVEILPESQSTVMEPAATEGGISQAAVDAVDSVLPVEEIPETQTVEPAAPQEIASDVEPPTPVEILPESQSTVMEPAATEGGISQAAVDAVDSVHPVEVISETQTVEPAAPLEIASDVEPPAPVEILTESQSTVMEPAATEGGISQSELEAVDSVSPVEVIPETQTVEPAAPLEIASDVEPAAPVEILPESQSTVMESAATEGSISQAAVDAVDSVPTVEEIPETQTVEPAAPLEIASDVEPAAPVEILPESQSTVMEPAATEGGISQSELEAVDSVSSVELISETQTVEPAAPLEVLPDVELIAAPETTICQNVLAVVDPVSPVEVISETQSVDPSAILTVSSEVDPPAPVDIILESQSTDVEPAATEKAISEAKLIAVASVELASETQSVDIFTAVLPEKLRQTEVVTREPPTSKEILPKTESVDLEPSEPGEVDKEAQLGNVVPEAQSIVARLEDVLPVKSASEEAPHTIQELISETLSLQEEESVAEKTDPEGQTIAVLSKLSPSEVPTNDQQIINTGDQLSEKCITEPAKPVVDPDFERNSSIDSLKSDCSALGKTSQKCLRRQPNIPDTTPSDGNSPVKSESLNLLGTICKFYIKDKRLLATIERRRRRSLIMHKYLSSFDSIEDSIDDETHPSIFEELNEDSLASYSELQPPAERAATPIFDTDPLDTFETETDLIDKVRAGPEEPQCFFISENNPESHSIHQPHIDKNELHHFISTDDKLESHSKHLENVSKSKYSAATVRLDMASQTSCDMSYEHDVGTESLIVFSLSDITYNFINEILFSDQLSTESHYSDDSEPSTACETFNGDGDSEQEFVSQTVLVLDEHRSQNTNTNSNSTLHSNLHRPLTLTNNPPSGSRRTNGKLTNGSLKWSGSYTTDLSHGGPPAAPQDGVAAEEDDVVLLRRFVPGSIAEREVKKWYNAVEMPNNPYAPEALKQRISGTQERYMDVPNISPSAEQKALASALTENTDPPSPQTDYKRYSRDYYINNAPKDSTGVVRATAASSFVDQQRSAGEDVEDIVINEVNQEPEPLPPHGRISSSAQSNVADLSHWTLSTPVRRSSSLKFINSRPSPRTSASTAPHSLAYERSATLERPSTSASHYRESGLGDDIDDDFEVRSQRSWRSSYSSLPKRHTQSSLSLHSNGSGMSFGSSVSKRRQGAGGGGPSAGVLTQFEKQLLHKDLKRNSFRAVSSTSKDFVMNPLFESEALGGKLTLRPETEDQGDSGVDSCLNGFSGADAKYSNNSLLF
ncbi:hypothetical protein KR059_009176 [Drosophila kikkawai]|nr:hypothetical protein KR059_009176 [Drosophila kikkawai]